MKSSDNSSAKTPPRPLSGAHPSRFALTGRSRAFDPTTDAIRPDIADVRLADRYFAPHYAAPVTFSIVGSASLRAERNGGTALTELKAGDTFEALEILRDTAWGIARPSGLVGYVPVGALGELA